ncbi:hypothetical protein [Arenibaculum pallidiluteum]|uniref:hypothetical protein n=1 Tax=Arenibaculum pallidiluteum TaxID=2812559 RepID=UPI001A97C781|nr:hypothetical protein [Arenibaculum pallidiluteum]
MAEDGSSSAGGTGGEKIEGPARDKAVTPAEGRDGPDAQVPSGPPPEGGADPRDIAEGEATGGGYG